MKYCTAVEWQRGEILKSNKRKRHFQRNKNYTEGRVTNSSNGSQKTMEL